MKTAQQYTIPEVEIVELHVEQGFAGSITGDGNDGEDGGVQD